MRQYKIILTGARGYLGQRLLTRLLSEGHILLCPIYSEKSRADNRAYENQNISFVNTLSNEYLQTISAFQPNVVINVAGVYDRSGNSAAKLTEGNLVFPLRLLNTVIDDKNSRIERFINACTSMPAQFNAYTQSKWQFAYWGKVYAERYGFAFANIKLEHFYGAYDDNIKFIQYIIEKLLADAPIDLTSGRQKRDFIHVDDVVDGFMHVLYTNLEGYSDIPLGSGEGVFVRELVEFMKAETGSASFLNFGAVKLRENEPMELIANLNIMRSFGFTPKYNWQCGLKSVIREMQGGL